MSSDYRARLANLRREGQPEDMPDYLAPAALPRCRRCQGESVKTWLDLGGGRRYACRVCRYGWAVEPLDDTDLAGVDFSDQSLSPMEIQRRVRAYQRGVAWTRLEAARPVLTLRGFWIWTAWTFVAGLLLGERAAKAFRWMLDWVLP